MLKEYIDGIKLLKYNGWEQLILNKLEEVRSKEIQMIFKQHQIRNIMDIFTYLIPSIISIKVFGLYIMLGNQFTVEKAFTVLAFLNLL